MKILKAVLAVLTIFVCAAMLATSAGADIYNRKTKVTFSGPVEIPGRVLPAGTYVFRLVTMQGVRNIVRIYNEDESKVITTILCIHDYRLTATDKPVIQFREQRTGAPTALRAWFYAGERAGLEFVYPKPRAVELAAAENVPVPAEEVGTTPSSLTTGPLVAEMPGNKEEPVEQAFQTTPPAAEAPLVAQATPALPKTGSSLPLVGLVGLISIALGAGLRLAVAMRAV